MDSISQMQQKVAEQNADMELDATLSGIQPMRSKNLAQHPQHPHQSKASKHSKQAQRASTANE